MNNTWSVKLVKSPLIICMGTPYFIIFCVSVFKYMYMYIIEVLCKLISLLCVASCDLVVMIGGAKQT